MCDNELKEIHEDKYNDMRYSIGLEKRNQGFNFFNIKPKNKKYYIEVMLLIDLNLKEKTSRLVVRTDLPFTDYSYRYDNPYDKEDKIKDFLKEFREWAKQPYYIYKNLNRKNPVGSYTLSISGLRKEKISFAEINFIIGELAEEYIKNIYLMDFKEEIKKIIALQREATREEKRAVKRWIYLKEKIKRLEEFVGKDRSEYSYSYREDKDKTLKIPLTKKEYNKKLKVIEKEIRELAKKYPSFFNVSESDFKYFKIVKKKSYEVWKKENLEELKEYYEEDEDYSFEEHCQSNYENYLDSLEGDNIIED